MSEGGWTLVGQVGSVKPSRGMPPVIERHARARRGGARLRRCAQSCTRSEGPSARSEGPGARSDGPRLRLADGSGTWLKGAMRVANLASVAIESGTWSSIDAQKFAVDVATEIRFSSSDAAHWVKWPLPIGRDPSSLWDHTRGCHSDSNNDCGANPCNVNDQQAITVTDEMGNTQTCYQSPDGYGTLCEHGVGFPAVSVNTNFNTDHDMCFQIHTDCSGEGYSCSGTAGQDAPVSESGWSSRTGTKYDNSYSSGNAWASIWLK